MKKRYFISQEKMLQAKTNPEIMSEIITEISGSINYIAILAHSRFFYMDSSIDINDVKNIISSEIVKSIQTSFIVNENINKNVLAYRNGYTFINRIFKYILNNLKMKKNRKKIIPVSHIVSLDDEKDNLKNKLIQNNIYKYDFIENIILKKIPKKNHKRLYKSVQEILKMSKFSEKTLKKYKNDIEKL